MYVNLQIDVFGSGTLVHTCMYDYKGVTNRTGRYCSGFCTIAVMRRVVENVFWSCCKSPKLSSERILQLCLNMEIDKVLHGNRVDARCSTERWDRSDRVSGHQKKLKTRVA